MMLARLLTPLALATTAAALPQDPFEPNDTCPPPATPLIVGGTTTGLTLGPDDDHYRLAVPANADVTVVARDGAGNELDVELLDASCASLAVSTAAPVRYFACDAPAGDLLVRVPGALFNAEPYELEVSVAGVADDSNEPNDRCGPLNPGMGLPAPIVRFSTPERVVTSCNEDYWFYRVLPNGYSLQIDVASSTSVDDVDLELFADDCTTLLDSSTSVGNTEAVRFVNTGTSPMVVKARVFMKGGEGHATYMLTACFTGPTFPPFIGHQVCESLANSTGPPATLCAIGSDVAMDNDVRLAVLELPSNSAGYFIASQSAGFVSMPGTTMGNLCLGTPGRYSFAVLNSMSTTSVFYQPDLTMTPVAGGGTTPVLAGQRWYWQYWYRDAVGGMATSNFSSAICVDFI